MNFQFIIGMLGIITSTMIFHVCQVGNFHLSRKWPPNITTIYQVIKAGLTCCGNMSPTQPLDHSVEFYEINQIQTTSRKRNK